MLSTDGSMAFFVQFKVDLQSVHLRNCSIGAFIALILHLIDMLYLVYCIYERMSCVCLQIAIKSFVALFSFIIYYCYLFMM